MHLLALKGVLHSENMNEKNPWTCLIKFRFSFLFWKIIINACLRHHPKSRTALHIMTILENFNLLAIMVLIRKKWQNFGNFIHFPFSFLPLDSTILHAFRSTISKTSARVSSEFPNTRKLMRARSRRLSASIVFHCLETLMKLNAPLLKQCINRTSGIKENGNIHEFFTFCRQVCCYEKFCCYGDLS